MSQDRIVFSARNKQNFTVLPNHLVRNGCKPNFFRVLCVIASYAWSGSSCTASISTMAKDSGVKRNTVVEAIKFWESQGQILVERSDGIGTKITTIFDFTQPVSREIPVSTGIPLPVSTGILKEDTEKKTNIYTDEFQKFWDAYPKHSGKKETFAAWAKIKPSLELQKVILDAVELHKKSEKWKKGFILDPVRWLKHERWNDEINLEAEKKAEESKKKPFIEGDPAFQKDGKWFVKTHSGQICEYVGDVKKNLVWK